MRYISHRGNLNGSIPAIENTPWAIKQAIQRGFDVEVDIWRVNGSWILGHDDPQHPIHESFLIEHIPSLWLHCKNVDALIDLEALNQFSWSDRVVARPHSPPHYFWHQEDDYATTSRKYVISYPGKSAAGMFSVCMLPERTWGVDFQATHHYLRQQRFSCVCSDHIQDLKNHKY